MFGRILDATWVCRWWRFQKSKSESAVPYRNLEIMLQKIINYLESQFQTWFFGFLSPRNIRIHPFGDFSIIPCATKIHDRKSISLPLSRSGMMVCAVVFRMGDGMGLSEARATRFVLRMPSRISQIWIGSAELPLMDVRSGACVCVCVLRGATL